MTDQELIDIIKDDSKEIKTRWNALMIYEGFSAYDAHDIVSDKYMLLEILNFIGVLPRSQP